MAIIEKKEINKIEIVGEHKHIQVREQTLFMDDTTGKIVGKGPYHRTSCMCGQDTQAAKLGVDAIANAVWTPAVRAAHTKLRAEPEAKVLAAQPSTQSTQEPINATTGTPSGI